MKELHFPKSLTKNIVIAMLLGGLLGTALNFLPNTPAVIVSVFDTFGKLFISSLRMLVVPLVFVSIVCGTNQLGEKSEFGKVALRTAILYFVTTGAALVLAISVSELLQVGHGNAALSAEGAKQATELVGQNAKLQGWEDFVINLIPINPIKSMAEGDMLQIIIFALLFGFAISWSGHHGKYIVKTLNALNTIFLNFVVMIMYAAPFGVFCLLTHTFADLGFEAAKGLMFYASTVILVLGLHMFGTFSILLRVVGQLNPVQFFKQVRPVLIFAFSTSSSNASIPVVLDNARCKLGISNSVASFIIPLGATINMDGTAIMQGVATVFVSHFYGIDLSLGQYGIVILMATLASIGTAGVPGVGLIMLSMVFKQVGLPEEGIGLLIGIDRLLDMIRTAVNVSGDSVISCIVAKREGEFDQEIFDGKKEFIY